MSLFICRLMFQATGSVTPHRPHAWSLVVQVCGMRLLGDCFGPTYFSLIIGCEGLAQTPVLLNFIVLKGWLLATTIWPCYGIPGSLMVILLWKLLLAGLCIHWVVKKVS